jgi:hypothetical protein
MTEPDRHIDVYRVGLLAALYFDLRAVRLGFRQHPLLGHTRRELGYMRGFARRGNWRAIRNACGGWHAEHAYAGTRCGTGWTRRRALRDLRRHLDQIGAQQ